MSLDLHGIEARNRRAFEYLDRKARQQAIEEAAFAMRFLLVLTALAGLALAIGGAS